jgi:glycosyltransferase involved in cell wall biosynthesis
MSEADNGPLVSCLMISRPAAGRFSLFKRGLRGYLNQRYSPRELVLVMSHLSAQQREAAVRHLRRLARPDVRLRYVYGNPTLGRLRNISLDMASGPLICQWDEDDIYHPDRLNVQVSHLRQSRRGGVFLQTLYHFFERSRELYIQDWGCFARPFDCHPGTWIIKKDPRVRYPMRGRHARKGEDVVFMLRHNQRHEHILLRDWPHIYVYVYHGGNTWDYEHHRRLAMQLSPPHASIVANRRAIESRLGDLDMPKGTIHVMSRNGLAFRWTKPAS